jgi:medium-chain acyl-[acyl-carrier-protein] hydrolase
LGSRSSGWILRGPSPAGARRKVFCFPYAGGAASLFHGWGDALGAETHLCAVQLPGRGGRFREAPAQTIDELVKAAADGLSGELDLPFALFGHSMGAVVAFELARELRRRGGRQPFLLVVSGHQAPHIPEPHPPFSHLPDPEFLEEARQRYDGIPAEVLAEPELLQLVLPVLRADIRALENYAYVEEAPLECPIGVFGGDQDHHVSASDLEAWRGYTRATVTLRTFSGGHFFVQEARSDVLRSLATLLGEGAPRW